MKLFKNPKKLLKYSKTWNLHYKNSKKILRKEIPLQKAERLNPKKSHKRNNENLYQRNSKKINPQISK